ncbi:hypothetical protein [Frateuria sp. STR12]|uniref:hypothetical protein n=1 Tax=Frateuria hangzhouensis TaxID=2995589 RepID=UPI002260F5E4|nr:hypothetical protein [Frateuria sp. STR12]MCX7512634.1 hypothetical protein [Frateuria sp. STR12]
MRKASWLLLAPAVVGACACSGLRAADQAAAASAGRSHVARPADGCQQLQAAIDPATGQLRELTAAERQALADGKPQTGSQRPQTAAEAEQTLRHTPRGMSMQLPDSRFNDNGRTSPPTGGCGGSPSGAGGAIEGKDAGG